jgi:hypothetical protein
VHVSFGKSKRAHVHASTHMHAAYHTTRCIYFSKDLFSPRICSCREHNRGSRTGSCIGTGKLLFASSGLGCRVEGLGLGSRYWQNTLFGFRVSGLRSRVCFRSPIKKTGRNPTDARTRLSPRARTGNYNAHSRPVNLRALA